MKKSFKKKYSNSFVSFYNPVDEQVEIVPSVIVKHRDDGSPIINHMDNSGSQSTDSSSFHTSSGDKTDHRTSNARRRGRIHRTTALIALLVMATLALLGLVIFFSVDSRGGGGGNEASMQLDEAETNDTAAGSSPELDSPAEDPGDAPPVDDPKEERPTDENDEEVDEGEEEDFEEEAMETEVTCKQQFYAADEVANHANEFDCWYILYDTVYELTDYWGDHPGGLLVEVFEACGTDATEVFWEEKKHNEKLLRKKAQDYVIGMLGEETGLLPVDC